MFWIGVGVFAGLAIVWLELVLLFAAPACLARGAFISLAERRIIRPASEARVEADAGYRSAPASRSASADPPLLSLGQVKLRDAVLLQTPMANEFALRVAIEQRYSLVRIAMKTERDALVLRARTTVLPLSLPFGAAMVGYWGLGWAEDGAWGYALVFGVLAIAYLAEINGRSAAHVRNAAVARAFDLLEREVQREWAGTASPRPARPDPLPASERMLDDEPERPVSAPLREPSRTR